MGDMTDNFSRSEFSCKDLCGADDISLELVESLQSVRSMLAESMTINCGVRCEAHNADVGGVPGSSHLAGLAADIAIPSSEYRANILPLLILNFSRIGIYKTFIHVDIDPGKPTPRTWWGE